MPALTKGVHQQLLSNLIPVNIFIKYGLTSDFNLIWL